MPDPGVLERLAASGLVRREAQGWRTTRRWQGAMARAALRLYRAGAPWQDLRLPIAAALVELCGELGDDEMVRSIEAMLPVEAAELGPTSGAASPGERQGEDGDRQGEDDSFMQR